MGVTRGGDRDTGSVRDIRKQFPEGGVTPCWGLKSEGGVGLDHGEGWECPRKKGRCVQRSCGVVASRN